MADATMSMLITMDFSEAGYSATKGQNILLETYYLSKALENAKRKFGSNPSDDQILEEYIVGIDNFKKHVASFGA